MMCLFPRFAALTAYDRGCKCKRCLDAVRMYHREYRKRRPEIIRAIVLRGQARKAKA